MGGDVGVHLVPGAGASRADAATDAEAVLRRMAAWADRLTRFTETSELSRLNRDPRDGRAGRSDARRGPRLGALPPRA